MAFESFSEGPLYGADGGAPAMMHRGVELALERKTKFPPRYHMITNPGTITFRSRLDQGFDFHPLMAALAYNWLPRSHRELLACVTRSRRRYR